MTQNLGSAEAGFGVDNDVKNRGHISTDPALDIGSAIDNAAGYQRLSSATYGGVAALTSSMTYHGAGMASGDETDITSYMASRTRGGGAGNTQRAREDADIKRQKMYTKTSRVYGYRPPRLHEQRSEIRRERYAEGYLSESSPVKVAVKGPEASVQAKAWDSRNIPRLTNKKQSVFQPPPPKTKSSNRFAPQLVVAPKVGMPVANEDLDEQGILDHVSGYISPSMRERAQHSRRPIAADSEESKRITRCSLQGGSSHRFPTPLSIRALNNEPSSPEEAVTPQRPTHSVVPAMVVQQDVSEVSKSRETSHSRRSPSKSLADSADRHPHLRSSTRAEEVAAEIINSIAHYPEAAASPTLSLPEDERTAVAATIEPLEQIIASLSEEVSRRREEIITLKTSTNEKKIASTSAAAECEVLRAEVKSLERELLTLQNTRKTVVNTQRDIDAKDKLIKEMERMIKALQGRLDKARAAAAAQQSTTTPKNEGVTSGNAPTPPLSSPLPLYPAGATLKDKTRIAAASRVKSLKQIAQLKTELNSLKQSIAELEGKNAKAQIIRDMQQQRLLAEREAIHQAYEKRELDALNQQLQKLKDDHARTKAHRIRVSKQLSGQKASEMETLAKKASNALGGEAELNRLLNDLKTSLDRHSHEADMAEAERGAVLASCTELANKLRAIEAKLAKREEELASQQRSIGDIHAQHRVTTEQTKHVNTTLLQELKARQTALSNLTQKLTVAQNELNALIAAEEKANFQHEQSIAEFGTSEQLNAKIAELNASIDRLVQERAKQTQAFAQAKQKQEAQSEENDKTIESLTKGLEVRKRSYESANQRNSDLLQRLDTAERLVAMYNLKK